MTPTLGGQRLLQIAVSRRPQLLLSALRRSGAVGRRESLEWVSPLEREEFREYKDAAALAKLRIGSSIKSPLAEFWPNRGCVWDGLALAGGRPVLIEAKAHIPEAVSSPTRAGEKSAPLIAKSLEQARRYFAAPRSKSEWGPNFYQYANRLAYQYFLRERNGLSSSLVFLYFTNATDMDGPATEQEWQGAVQLIHAMLGLPKDLSRFGVHHAFLDARPLMDGGRL
jgi:hypothetical protein